MSDLIAKLAKAAQDVGGKLSADKTNKEQNYEYLSADKILSISGQALAGQGIMIIPQLTGRHIDVLEYTDKYNNAKRRYDCQVDFVFTITDGGDKEILSPWVGMGSDYMTPDKAVYKAITSGHKYFLMKLLCIGAGNEDGEHETEDEKQPAKPANKPAPKPAEQKREEPAAQTAPTLGDLDLESITTWAKEFNIQPNHMRQTFKLSALPVTAGGDEIRQWVIDYKAERTRKLEPAEAAEIANSKIKPTPAA
jgi:hypothetical protein